MSYVVQNSGTLQGGFTTHNPTTGAAANADSPPTGTLYINGTASGNTVTITNNGIGDYDFSVPLSGSAAGDVAWVVITATVNSVTAKTALGWVRVSNYSPVDLTAARVLNLDNADAAVSSRSTLDAAGVWGHSSRSLTTFGTLVSDVAAAVWGAGTRSLTTFGTLVSDVAAAVWGAASRTLTAFGFTVDTNANSTETAIKTVTDRLQTTIELDGSVWRFTVKALEQAPSGGGGGGATVSQIFEREVGLDQIGNPVTFQQAVRALFASVAGDVEIVAADSTGNTYRLKFPDGSVVAEVTVGAGGAVNGSVVGP